MNYTGAALAVLDQ
ncbi:WD repeat domain 41 (predicted), isoform CRA_c [Rattus norvegicus]|uniref:WD repeat domain 41 (Predicted), isoform CRA_c n=1 Tax=Rattus norvegicus TaxID=10116 RepID=A6I4X8_RAT|nr:WD repeat domain 41 (predicted), isoform CRA_c [Rattus norvegicus]